MPTSIIIKIEASILMMMDVGMHQSRMGQEEDEVVPFLGQPSVRYDDLNNNSSIYEYAYAAPDDDVLVLMWILEAAVLVLVVLTISVVLAAVMSTKKTRLNPYNVYLQFLMFPDLLYSFACVITCALCAAAGHYVSKTQCVWQAWYLTFGCTANGWINAIVSYELYHLLLCNARRQHYFAPSLPTVVRRCLLVYTGTAIFATLAVSRLDWLHVDSHFGEFCFPSATDTTSSIYMWTTFFPLAFGLPYTYVAWVSYDICYRSKLMPPAGLRRFLAVYFFRIIAVFAIMWIPSVVSVTVLTYVKVHPWVRWGFGVWSHLQGLVSAVFTSLKPDISNAVRDLFKCKPCRPDPNASLRSLLDFGQGFGFTEDTTLTMDSHADTDNEDHIVQDINNKSEQMEYVPSSVSHSIALDLEASDGSSSSDQESSVS